MITLYFSPWMLLGKCLKNVCCRSIDFCFVGAYINYVGVSELCPYQGADTHGLTSYEISFLFSAFMSVLTSREAVIETSLIGVSDIYEP